MKQNLPAFGGLTDEEVLDELAIRLAKKVMAEEKEKMPASAKWRKWRIREILLEAMLNRTLEAMDVP